LPDGKSIAFNDFPLPGHMVGIKVLDLSNRKISAMPGSVGFYVPSWSPDGKCMVALAQNPSRIVLYSAQSGRWKDLRRFEAPWGYWVWSSDSESIYMAMTAAELAIYRLAIADGTWSKVARFDGPGAGYSMVPVRSVSTTFGHGPGRRGTGERELQKC
jgi:Tol biopolymer transport system component